MDQDQLKSVIEKAPKTLQLGQLESQVIALALENKGFFLKLLGFLQPTHFDTPDYSQIWGWMTSFYNSAHVLPTRAIVEHACSQSDWHFSIPPVNIRESEYVGQEVFRVVRRQQLEQFLIRLIMLTRENDPELDEAYAEFSKIRNMRYENLQDWLNYFDVDTRYARLQHFWDSRLSTGFPTLDLMLPGNGLGPKEMVAIMGPPGAGKTLWLINIAARIMLRGQQVLHLTREVSEDIVGLRYDCAILNGSATELLGDTPATIDRLKTLRRNFGFDSENPLWIREYPTGTAKISQAKADYQLLKEQENVRATLCVDDYPDLARPEKQLDKDYSNIGMVFSEFRGWMVEEVMAGLVATQTTRDAEDMRDDAVIQMRHTSDSYHKPRLLDCLMTINESAEDKVSGHQRLYAAKNRNEKSGVWGKFKVDKGRMRITDIKQSSFDVVGSSTGA